MVPEVELEDEETSASCSPRGSVARQLAAVCPVYVLQLCYGMTSGYPAVTTPQLTANCSALRITAAEESWVVAIDSVVSPATSLAAGALQQQLGPRAVLGLTCLPYILGWRSAALAGHFASLYLLYLSR